MFKNVGAQIKFWALVIVVLFIIIGLVAGALVYGAYSALQGSDILICFLIIVGFGLGGLVVGYFLALLLYGFGELIDSTQKIREKLEQMDLKESKAPQPAEMHDSQV